MNFNILRDYKQAYRDRFEEIGKKEIYKWRAVKRFQDNWNIESTDLKTMLSDSLKGTGNLLASGLYYPRRMIRFMADLEPNQVKRIFLRLFDETNNVFDRVEAFQEDVKIICAKHFPGKNAYQDHRAIVVYLSLKFPDRYYFYKYELLRKFCNNVKHDITLRKGDVGNIAQYFDVCSIVKDELLKDDELVRTHLGRLGEKEYPDPAFNILTQDFMFAVANYFSDDITTNIDQTFLLEEDKEVYTPILDSDTGFRGRHTDFVGQQVTNSRVGKMGELLVMNWEQTQCHPNKRQKIEHSSAVKGDGLGFDILSYDKNGNKRFIEVKTTKGGPRTPFFITSTELRRSQVEGDKYYLYRLYDFDEERMSAKYFILHGDLSHYCQTPSQFKVMVV